MVRGTKFRVVERHVLRKTCETRVFGFQLLKVDGFHVNVSWKAWFLPAFHVKADLLFLGGRWFLPAFHVVFVFGFERAAETIYGNTFVSERGPWAPLGGSGMLLVHRRSCCEHL